VDAFTTKLSEPRRLLLATRGIAAIKVHVQTPSEHGWFRWLVKPKDDGTRSLKWYIDGSAVDGPSWYTTRLGFGIVVVTGEGQLVGYGYGSPPAWVRDAAGAEAWALVTVARENPQLPSIVTDCLGLVNTAAAGRAAATHAKRPQARLWGMFFHYVDDAEAAEAAHRTLVWMPSHCTLAAARFRCKSDGSLVSALDWRANRLVDALAKAGAEAARLPRDLTALVHHAEQATEYAAALVGLTSWAANNQEAHLPDGSGGTYKTTLRDSQPPPATRVGVPTGTGTARRRGGETATPGSQAHAPTGNATTTPSSSTAPPAPARLRAAAEQAACLQREVEREARTYTSWLQEMATKKRVRDDTLTATERLEALRRRVKAKQDMLRL